MKNVHWETCCLYFTGSNWATAIICIWRNNSLLAKLILIEHKESSKPVKPGNTGYKSYRQRTRVDPLIKVTNTVSKLWVKASILTRNVFLWNIWMKNVTHSSFYPIRHVWNVVIISMWIVKMCFVRSWRPCSPLTEIKCGLSYQEAEGMVEELHGKRLSCQWVWLLFAVKRDSTG